MALRPLLVALGALAGMSLTAVPAAAAPAAPEQPTCAWSGKVSADATNVLWPDTAATYWTLPFTVQPDLRIVLSGHFADSRYSSFIVYRADGGGFVTNGVESVLADYQMAPDEGSASPWREAVPPGGAFTLTVRPDPEPGQVNTLPLAPADTPAGTRGYLVYRVYLPTGGADAVPLPAVTLVQGGVATALPACTDSAARDTLLNVLTSNLGRTAGTPSPGGIAFARPIQEPNLVANMNTGYLAALITPPADGQVVVVRGRAPVSPPGTHPSVWPSDTVDVRYWSMCTNLQLPQAPVVINRLRGGGVDYGCRGDDQTVLDAAGRYTFVLGTEAQRTVIEKIPGVTFVPFSLTHPHAEHIVFLRNMLAAPGFAQAIQNVPTDGNPASAAAVLGDYYPRDAVCPLATLARGGAAGCGLA